MMAKTKGRSHIIKMREILTKPGEKGLGRR